MNIDKYKDCGLSGLTNLGNTCYLNSTMQILSHTYELNDYLDNLNKYKINDIDDSLVLHAWNELRLLLWKDNHIIAPNKFVKIIQKVSKTKKIDTFTGFSQNDMPEFLLFIIDCFHNALSKKVTMSIKGKVKNKSDKLAVICFEKIKQMYENDYSKIWSLFYGVHVSTITNKNKKPSITPEPYFIISLPIPEQKTPTLIDCFDLYVEKETIGDSNDNNYITKKIDFWSFPDILVLDLKRFHGSSNRKNQIFVDFPLENLDLSKYVVGYNSDSYIYDLYGVCNHSGSVLGGHYTAYVKNANNKWYHFNDTSVTEVATNIKTPKAYCFFYRKRKNV